MSVFETDLVSIKSKYCKVPVGVYEMKTIRVSKLKKRKTLRVLYEIVSGEYKGLRITQEIKI